MSNWRDRIESISTQVIQCESVLPVNTDSNRNPVVFHVRATPGLIVDSKNIKLSFNAVVQKKKGDSWEDLKMTDKVCPYQNFGFSVWEDVQLFLGGTLCETSLREYPRTSYLRNMLFTSEREQMSLESALFLKDSQIHGDTVLQSDDKDPGGAHRSLIVKDGKEITVLAPVYSDILQSGSYIPDTTGFTLRFYPAKSDKCLLQEKSAVTAAGATTDQFQQLRVVISHAELRVPRCRLSGVLPKTITSNFECCKVLNYVSPKDMKTFSCSLNSDLLPSKIAMVLLSEDRFEGKQGESGLFFHHQYVGNITVKSNGNVLPTLSGMNMDPENKDWSQPYSALFTQLNAVNPYIALSSFDNGNAIYGISLQHGAKKPFKGTCDIDLTFQKAPTKNLVILLFCYYNSKYSIDKNGILKSEINAKL